MEITAPETDDADAIADAWVDLAAGQRRYGSLLRAEANREAVREAITRSIVVGGLLAAYDPDLVGFVMFGPESGTYEQRAEKGVVENLYVVPGRQGEGIGTALLEAAEETLAAGGAEVITLDVMADNDDARRFYRKRGYDPHRVTMTRAVKSDTHSNADDG
jgi:ribosomal protein S18 acetylase RimI-like enzyme